MLIMNSMYLNNILLVRKIRSYQVEKIINFKCSKFILAFLVQLACFSAKSSPFELCTQRLSATDFLCYL